MKKLLLPIKKVYWFFKHYYKLYLSHYNRKKYADILFRDQFGRNIDWENPRDLNEKIQWLDYRYMAIGIKQQILILIRCLTSLF